MRAWGAVGSARRAGRARVERVAETPYRDISDCFFLVLLSFLGYKISREDQRGCGRCGGSFKT